MSEKLAKELHGKIEKYGYVIVNVSLNDYVCGMEAEVHDLDGLLSEVCTLSEDFDECSRKEYLKELENVLDPEAYELPDDEELQYYGEVRKEVSTSSILAPTSLILKKGKSEEDAVEIAQKHLPSHLKIMEVYQIR